MDQTQPKPQTQQPAPKCALCKAPATRVLPMLVQMTTTQQSPLLIGGATAPRIQNLTVQVLLCDACQVTGARLGLAPPVPLEEPKLVQQATPGELDRLSTGRT